MTQHTTILHISDIHIEADPDKRFDRSVVLDPLLKRVREDYAKGLRPELVAVTGDIAFKGIRAEYDVAAQFFADLLGLLNLKSDRLFLVPGNHDVNRKKYRPTDIPRYDTVQALNEELEQYRDDLFKGMREYFDFVTTRYPHLQPVQDDLIPFVTTFEAASGKRLGLIGLNSAWMCRKSPDEREIAIGEYQIKNAVEELKKSGNVDLNLFLLHHSINYLRRDDRDVCRSYIDGNRSILLTGHLHEPAGWILEDLDGRLVQFQAGGAYLGSESSWPSRYQYVTLDWENNRIQLDFRAYNKEKRRWHVDAEVGVDGHKEFDLFPREQPAAASRVATVPPISFPDAYRQWLIENYQHLDADKLYGSEMMALNLPEIFIQLYADAPEGAGKRRGQMSMDPKDRKPVDLEELIANRDTLLIEGHPGSGKTTLMKHVTYCLAKEGAPCVPLTPLAGFLPILIFFKDLHDYFKDHKEEEVSALDIIGWCCTARMGATIDAATVRAFIEQRRALILLDGMDELPQPHRDSVVTRFADLRLSHPGVRLLITGRPHGIDGAALKRFGQARVAINTLTMEQVEIFVTKWFRYFYPGDSGPGGRTAAGLINEVKTHPAVGALIDNPLMLTAICILYHDQKELPGQRAELYKRFVDNMLFRRFGPDFEEVLAFLKILAHTLHTGKTKIIDEIGALEKMRQSFRRKEREDGPEYEARIRKRFAEIEAQCGLLKLEAGGYEFRHLTFQEFLCADYLSDTATDYHAAIAPFWNDEWYREMIELYISYISIRNKGMANAIVARALEQADQGHWLKAAAALNDIQENRRDSEVVTKARDALQRIFRTEEKVSRKILAEAGELLGWLGDPRDLKAFVLIAGGEYDLEELGRRSIAPFELGNYPVTNGWFREFVDAGGYAAREWWSKEGWRWRLAEKVEHPELWHDRRWRCPNAPVVGVSWHEAGAFCRWLTKTAEDGRVYRLPTEAEWQAAAAGHERRVYAWGNDEDPTRCNCGEGDASIDATSAVGIFERGKSPDGVYDLNGNVWEWCEDVIEGSARVLRGGSWFFNAWFCRSAYRSYYSPGYRLESYGFRLARGQQESGKG